MNINSEKKYTVYRYENDGKISYSLGIAKKKEDGTYENGYIPVRFRKDVELDNKTKIIIKQAWLEFYKKEKNTILYIFINEFEKAQEEPKPVDNWDSAKDVEITQDDLPFYN